MDNNKNAKTDKMYYLLLLNMYIELHPTHSNLFQIPYQVPLPQPISKN